MAPHHSRKPQHPTTTPSDSYVLSCPCLCVSFRQFFAVNLSSQGVAQSAKATHGGVTCSAEATWLPSHRPVVTAPGAAYVVFAFEGKLVFPNTPDVLSLQICALLLCVPTVAPNGMVSCQSTADAPTSLPVAAVALQASYMPSVVVFPMFLTDRAQVLTDPALTDLRNLTLPTSTANTTWEFKSVSELGVPLLSATMYGIDQVEP